MLFKRQANEIIIFELKLSLLQSAIKVPKT